ncbi:unnamed protein product [Darwinula stevensoni]|uniref:Uncharacterized protein n=1 Tax=Darwinula stevensoni TaxID=69355 RepID=A0A7R8ZYU6_9CRUS|nr:unnamed protein product [Darwinula stevensoni]CAG0882227.1 unnamed protein product [Darwinula stevensoni]
MDPFDGAGIRQSRRNEKEDRSKEPESDLPRELEPNLIVESAINLTFVIFDQIDNLAPLMTIEWPIVETTMSIPYTDLPLRTGIRLTEGTVHGLNNVIRRGEATIRREGRTFVVNSRLLLKSAQFKYTLEMQTLFLNFREKLLTNLFDVLVELEVRANIDFPYAASLAISKLEILNIGDMNFHLGVDGAGIFSRFLETVMTYARALFPGSVHEFLEQIGQDALERGTAKGVQILNESSR